MSSPIVATGDTEVEFLSRYRDVLFPDTPIVFNTAAPVKALPNSTGILSRLTIGNTLDMALKIQPDTQLVVVVGGASEFDESPTKRQHASSSRPSKAVSRSRTDWTADPRPAAAGGDEAPHSIIFFVTLAEDGEGRRFDPTEMLDAVSAAANVPTYMWLNEGFGRGIVGGKMLSAEAVALRLSDLAVRVLKGERADTIPITEFDWGTNLFDWRQLERWGISESRLPHGSVVQSKCGALSVPRGAGGVG